MILRSQESENFTKHCLNCIIEEIRKAIDDQVLGSLELLTKQRLLHAVKAVADEKAYKI